MMVDFIVSKAELLLYLDTLIGGLSFVMGWFSRDLFVSWRERRRPPPF
jgi:hypothetical protein